MTEPIGVLRDAYAGQTCYVVGKGPSLRYLTPADFGPGPVITLNEAIAKVLPFGLPVVFSMQKDGASNKVPDSVALLVHQHESADIYLDHGQRYLFDNPVDFGLAWNKPSALVAIKIAELWGCTRIVLLCFDAAVNGDTGCVSDGVGEVTRHYEGYLLQAVWMREMLAKNQFESVKWVLPR